MLRHTQESHERYKALRSSFYVDVGGVIIVTDGAEPKRCASLSLGSHLTFEKLHPLWLPISGIQPS